MRGNDDLHEVSADQTPARHRRGPGRSHGGCQRLLGGDLGRGHLVTIRGSGKVEGTIRLSYWGSGQRVELTNGVSDLFTKANAGVKVTPEYTDFASYWNKLNVQATSGNMACVAQMQGRQLNDYASKGLLIDLEPLTKDGTIDVSQIPKNVLDTGRGTDGKLYEIPYGAAYDSIMINQTLAKQAGVGLPAAGLHLGRLPVLPQEGASRTCRRGSRRSTSAAASRTTSSSTSRRRARTSSTAARWRSRSRPSSTSGTCGSRGARPV